MVKTEAGGVSDKIVVSIICLAYNHEKYIRKTLEGFVTQKTNFKYEVLIHDDASTDGTANIIHEYELNYPDIIKPVYQKINQYSQGVKISQEYLFPLASGDYLAWCEGDDYWCDDNKLQKQYDIMENHPECSICVHRVKCINENGSENQRMFPPDNYHVNSGILEDDLVANLIWVTSGFPFQLSSYFIRKSIFNEYMVGDIPFQKYFVGDQTMMRECLYRGKYYLLDDIMSSYRIGSLESFLVRHERMSDYEKMSYKLKEIEGDAIYDKYTGFKFHHYISIMITKKLISVSRTDPYVARDKWYHYNLEIKNVKNDLSVKQLIKLLLIIYMPWLIRSLYCRKR